MINRIIENPWWRLSMDIFTILSILGLSGIGIINLFRSFGKNPVLIVIILFSASLVLFFLIGKAKKIGGRIEKAKIKVETAGIQEKSEEEFLKGLPLTKTLKKWFSNIQKRAEGWDPDSVLTSLNFYISHGYETKHYASELSMQARFYSKWKNLEGYFYLPSKTEEGDFEERSYFSKKRVRAFFLEHSGWKGALRRAHEMISDRLPDKFELQITSGEKMKFNYYFTQGRVKKKEAFEYNGDILRHIKTDKKIEL